MTAHANTGTTRSLTGTLAATALGAGILASTVPALADEALADLVEEVAPAVVTVLSTRDSVPSPAGFGGGDHPGSSPFEEFFRQFGPGNGFPAPFQDNQPREGLGSGFILDSDGWIVTNHHVVDGSDSVTVRLSDDREFDAEIIGVDEQTDLALLRIDAEGLPHVELGDSDAIRVGEDVMAVGNPFGLGGTVTTGIVSAKGRNIAAGPYADFIQTDAAINKGNSGGPLFNMDGEVVGVNSAIYSPSGGSVGVGFAVTSNIVDLIVDDLRDDGMVSRGWLGVSIQTVTPDLAEALGLEAAEGALVASVVEGSPSEDLLKAGDVILSFDGKPVSSSRDLPRLVAATGPGETVDVVVQRAGSETTVPVEIGTFAADHASLDADDAGEGSAYEALGATVADLTDNARGEIGVGEDVTGAVVTSLAATGPAAKAGLRVGDVIVQVGDAPVTSADALRKALDAAPADPALVLVNRSGRQIFLAVDLV